MQTPQKVGALVPDGWLAYARDGHLFVKTFDYARDARYPDLGCSAEIFINAEFLETESLAPLVTLEPGAAVEHIEHWFLFRDVPAPDTEADVEVHLLPQIRAAKAQAAQMRAT